jgi:hypothetical protein
VVAIKMVGRRPNPIDTGTQRKHPMPMSIVGPVTNALICHTGMS